MLVTSPTTGGHPFDLDTAVEGRPGGRFGAVLTDRWDRLGGGPLGGYSMAVALRALAAAQPLPDLLAASAYFLRPARHGPAEVAAELARHGRSVATGEARLLQGGGEAVRVLASFTDLDAVGGRGFEGGRPPALPPPERCADPLAGLPLEGVSIAERVEYRCAEVPGWARGAPSGRPEAECWLRFREPRLVDALSLPLLVDAMAPVVLELGASGSSTLELTIHVRRRPATGWLACRATTRHVAHGYHEEDVEVWDERGELVAQSRQLARLSGW